MAAALTLGFTDAPADYFKSDDVDIVLSLRQGEELLATTNFWDAINEVNREFEEKGGLYITHFFTEEQVILTPEWESKRVRIEGPWQKLFVYRLGNEDLFLSKLMRDDPQDRMDARFIADRAGWSNAELETIIASARVPDIAELREEFAGAAKHFLSSPREGERVVLASSALAAVAYDRQKQTLDVEFRDGGTYRYLNVPQSIYRDLLKAESAGAFWNEVKADFAHVRLD